MSVLLFAVSLQYTVYSKFLTRSFYSMIISVHVFFTNQGTYIILYLNVLRKFDYV